MYKSIRTIEDLRRVVLNRSAVYVKYQHPEMRRARHRLLCQLSTVLNRVYLSGTPQYAIANMLGVTPTTVSYIINCKNDKVSMAKLMFVADRVGVPYALCMGEGEESIQHMVKSIMNSPELVEALLKEFKTISKKKVESPIERVTKKLREMTTSKKGAWDKNLNLRPSR